jgi:hypothetical protein
MKHFAVASNLCSRDSVSSPHKTLVIIELNIRRCGSIILIVRKDIDAVVLPHIQATIGSTEVDINCGFLRHG